ncbi:PepSY domain-containing protein [Pseudomonas sp. TTU2014-080ASC]|uniref:PepSY domain-containing protein n=1 Tax=Pseudomonas sp. TTU2014-080ASC TaxID=1729724 RepID=UPI0007188F1F|nr:PepSY domain-containing protein [Pseudomonas sp. TTU2014-080ASC]KRW57980.1 peptidase [Pseudomonas sp. TTU2014-080ASC]
MKTLIALSAAASLAMVTSLAQARDIGLDEALQLQSAGKIKPVAELTAAALSQHAGGKAEYTELEEELGRLIYQVEVRDAQGVKWDVDVDAVSGQILKNKRDD